MAKNRNKTKRNTKSSRVNRRNGGETVESMIEQFGNNKLKPQQWAIILGILTNALTVDSVLLDKNMKVLIVLGGSLRKTRSIRALLGTRGLTFEDLIEILQDEEVSI